MKKYLYCLVLAAFFAVLTGCSQSEEEKNLTVQTENENSIWIYYPENREVARSEELYQLKQPDLLSVSVEEIISALIEKIDGEKLDFRTYLLDEDNNISIEFVQQESCYKEYALLVKASVSKTLFQMEEIGSVNICMYDERNRVISNELFLEDSFYFYGNDEEKTTSRSVNLYYANEAGTALKTETVQIFLDDNITLEEAIIKELCNREALPEGTKVNSVSFRMDTCYLDLSSEFVNNMENVKSDIVLYSVVNSVTSVTGQVQILIDGKIVDSYRGNSSISKPLGFNTDMLQ